MPTSKSGESPSQLIDARIKELFPSGMTREKFSFQMSDHLPVWVQIDTNIEGQRLNQIIQDGKK